MNNKVLFLTLRIFSATGGIEKVCKVLSKGLQDIHDMGNTLIGDLSVLSMYDQPNDADEKYISNKHFKGFSESKLSFVMAAVRGGCNSKVVILSHVNLLLIGFLIKLFAPRTKLLLLAHGIEVWSPISLLRMRTLTMCDRILCVSLFTKEKMKGLFNIPEEKFTVLNNCLDPFLPAIENRKKDPVLLEKMGFKQHDFILYTLTRLSSKERYKGYDSVLHSVHVLRQKYPRIKYLIVGKFDKEEVIRVSEMIKELGIQSHVYLAGFIADKDLARYFQLADLYVMPSKKEGFGIVFIEAMYYGLPVIAGNKDGSADALLNGALGVLVDPDAQNEINEAVESVLLNPAARTPDRRLLLKNFGFDHYKYRVKEILESL